ncbi:MAG: Gfo/Idh/MocA family oxidoreductase [Fimbriimonadaceae bacterium]
MGKTRVGLIGCGGFQRHRLGNLLKVDEAEVVALVDPAAEQIALMREQHPGTQGLASYPDHQTMLAETRPDAVLIATPHTQHVNQIMDSFAAGCHVLTEKPMVTSVEDAHRVIAGRDAAGRVGMVSYQRHFQPEFRQIREMIASGEAGAVHYITVLQSQEWLRLTKGTWRQELALSGGGQLNDSGSHVLDIVLWTTGLSPRTVSAFCDNKGTEVDINSTMSVLFDGGAMASIAIIGDGMSWHEEITIWCENMAFFVREGKLRIVDRSGSPVERSEGENGSADRNFIEAILGRAKCESPFECGLEVIRLTEAAWTSSAQDGAPARVS